MKMLPALLALSTLAFADDVQPYAPPAPPAPPPVPWLTGTLIAPPGTVVGYGDFTIESYVYCTTNTGTYNSNWETVSNENNFFVLNPQFLCFFGLTSWCDLNFTPQFTYNTTQGQNGGNIGDFSAGFDFQLLDAAYTPYFPGIKFTVKETFPTGKFQNFNPNKLLTDQTGAGTYGTNLSLVLYKVYYFGKEHWLSNTITASYTLNTPVHVHGFNTYGGGYGTDGRALPGNSFQGIFSFEFSFTHNWAIACDIVYQHTDETQFYGNPGTAAAGGAATVGAPSQEQLSFAPAIEYNFNVHFGIIAGCWLTAVGRNSTEFRSGVVEFYYAY